MIDLLLLLAFSALSASTNAHADLPELALPWGKWQATVYPEDAEVPKIYLFKNVRFGAEPERFSGPSFPDSLSSDLQNDSRNISRIQIDLSPLRNPPGGKNPLGDPRNSDLVQTEDCLFLDVYAPVSAFQPGAEPLPVVVWFYGGAFAFGNKNQDGPLYTGQSILTASNDTAIYIVGNYRLGAFGWLAGHYMESSGQPNAGLYDQALLLSWVQEYVDRVGGDPSRVSAWGQSAGGSSILHHLIREDGNQDPLFKTFAVQSPAFEWAWDNSADGRLDTLYRKFSNHTGCGFEYNIECLRKNVSVETLATANQLLFKEVRQTGLFPIGPAVDGKWIKSIPKVAFSQGNFWKGIDSAIISHCTNESVLFTPPNIDNQTMFDELLNVFLPGDQQKPQREAIRQQYNCTIKFEGDFTACIATLIRDAAFTCNTRDLFDSYPDKSYMMEYGFPSNADAYHSSDLIPLFMNNLAEAKYLLIKAGLDSGNATTYAFALQNVVRKNFQDYFASFALSGNPNTRHPNPPVTWPIANGDDDQLSDVLKVKPALLPKNAFGLVEDDQNSKSICSFWTGIAKDIVHGQRGTNREGGSLQLQLFGASDEL
ncbi:Lipase 1 [Tolypocladium ophioglossoides CBS 100239]|uniref:Lipase 1 n=1 Tax=Tolypocladium ophioglossoides (strain CBS 100239) TaxID=1163406 RepID=A0A0L0N5R8_TOLOC|nr:Lipase 1 [Tolypocladium ophioglossoides CBS 100239]